ncbi:MAG: IclR family transcriptional regulator [Anaerolineae bacterium]|nr:IclR family transcriptional regulator [Anaerolineae bacterium]
MNKQNSGNSVIERMCAVLNVFSEEEKVLTLSEISRRIRLPKSTTHRFLTALVEQGLLYKEADGHKFRLGFQLLRWGMLAQRSIDFRNLALPILKKLCQTTGETVVLSVRDGDAGIWIEQIESDQAFRIAKREGVRLMLHAGASSKVLLAFLKEEEINRILTQIELVPLQKNTIVDKDELRKELQITRQRGYATSFEETDHGAMGIAAPVYDHYNKLIAGIGIVAPINRVTRDHVPAMAELVVAAGRELSTLLGATIFDQKFKYKGGERVS